MNNSTCVIHRAKWIVLNPDKIIENGFIEVESGRIKHIGTGRNFDRRVVDHGQGVLMPGLVNAHTHLELSALTGKITFNQGFKKWVATLLELRDGLSRDEILSAAVKGIESLVQSGCVATGEISTLGLTRDVFLRSEMHGVWFEEHLGAASDCQAIEDNTEFNAVVSYAGHAPHTTSPAFLKILKEKANDDGLPFSIHLSESEEESNFISTRKGQWADFLTMRGIDFSSWPLPCKTPVKYLDMLNILDDKTIAVHLISADLEDLQIIRERGVKICLCPRSNMNLHNKLPDIDKIISLGIKPCLGTDSLASAQSLDIFDEMSFVADSFPSISPPDILSMACLNGAAALGVEKNFGTIEPGKLARFIYLPLLIEKSKNVIEPMVHGDFSRSGIKLVK